MYSVIIPVYNREKNIKIAVQSVLEQVSSDWELILVDDCSYDSSAEICDEYSRKDPRVKVFHHCVNKGVSAARNTGLNNASGEYVFFLDSDDFFVEDTISFVDEHISTSKPDIVCFGIGGWIPSEKFGYEVLDKKFMMECVLPEHIDAAPQTEAFLMPYVCNKCFKRELIDKVPIRFNEAQRNWEDNGFFVRCLISGNSLMLLPKSLYMLGIADDHLSFHFNISMVWDIIASFNSCKKEYGNLFNFDNPYTVRRYFENTDRVLFKIKAEYSEQEFRNLLKELICDDTMCMWVTSIKPDGKHERLVRKAFLNNDEEIFFKAYNFQKKEKKSGSIVKKLKRLIKSIIGAEMYEKIKKKKR